MFKACKIRPGLCGLMVMGVTALGLFGTAPARADFVYTVSIQTDALNTNSGSAPYSLFFELTDGSGTGDGNNTVTLTDFNVAGPASPIVLTDNSFFVDDTESFTAQPSPDSVLSFKLDTTNNTDVGFPDEFSAFILDNGSNPIPTTDSAASSLLTIDLGGSSPTITSFQGTGDFAGVNASLTPSGATPEPATPIGLAVALALLGVTMAVRRRTGLSVQD